MLGKTMRRFNLGLIAAFVSAGLLGGCIVRDDNNHDHGDHQGYVKNGSSYWQGRKDQRYNDRHSGGWWRH